MIKNFLILLEHFEKIYTENAIECIHELLKMRFYLSRNLQSNFAKSPNSIIAYLQLSEIFFVCEVIGFRSSNLKFFFKNKDEFLGMIFKYLLWHFW